MICNYKSAMMMAVEAGSLLFAAAPARADDGRFASIADILTSPEFIDDCVGRDGGTILLSFAPTYRKEHFSVAAALKKTLLTTGAAEQVFDYQPVDWRAAATCDARLPPGPRVVLFISLAKDLGGALKVARVLVRANDRCKRTRLERGYYPGRCHDVRTSVPNRKQAPPFAHQALTVPVPTRPRHAADPRRQQARDRVTGLLTGTAIQASMVLGLRVAQAGVVRDDPESAKLIGAVAYTSTLGLTTLSAYTARAWVETTPAPWRRRRSALGMSGAALLTLGGAAVATIEYVAFRARETGSPEVTGLRLLQAFGEFSAAAGVGLITFALHSRVSLSPSMAGVTISGRF
jgi:hypothetical protein